MEMTNVTQDTTLHKAKPLITEHCLGASWWYVW
jgi:hypothetical protein